MPPSRTPRPAAVLAAAFTSWATATRDDAAEPAARLELRQWLREKAPAAQIESWLAPQT